eukprot:scaffold55868_cov19-Tisochrysis_lutea.AAC.1
MAVANMQGMKMFHFLCQLGICMQDKAKQNNQLLPSQLQALTAGKRNLLVSAQALLAAAPPLSSHLGVVHVVGPMLPVLQHTSKDGEGSESGPIERERERERELSETHACPGAGLPGITPLFPSPGPLAPSLLEHHQPPTASEVRT